MFCGASCLAVLHLTLDPRYGCACLGSATQALLSRHVAPTRRTDCLFKTQAELPRVPQSVSKTNLPTLLHDSVNVMRASLNILSLITGLP